MVVGLLAYRSSKGGGVCTYLRGGSGQNGPSAYPILKYGGGVLMKKSVSAEGSSAAKSTAVKGGQEKPIYCSMKMPDWFLDLDVGEKKRLIKKMATESVNAHTLTPSELKGLMSSAI